LLLDALRGIAHASVVIAAAHANRPVGEHDDRMTMPTIINEGTWRFIDCSWDVAVCAAIQFVLKGG
jgi:hypothetical protein